MEQNWLQDFDSVWNTECESAGLGVRGSVRQYKGRIMAYDLQYSARILGKDTVLECLGPVLTWHE